MREARNLADSEREALRGAFCCRGRVWRFPGQEILEGPSLRCLTRVYLAGCIYQLVVDSEPPRPNRQLIVYYYYLRYEVDGFVGELTFSH